MRNERGNISFGTLIVILLLVFCAWLYFKDDRFKTSIDSAAEVAVEHGSAALESMQTLDKTITPLDLETGIKRLRKGEYSHNVDIALHLGRDSSPETREKLVSLLGDRQIGLYAAMALGRMGTDAVPDLEQAIASDDDLTRINAAEALWRTDTNESVEILKDALKKEKPENLEALVSLRYAISQAEWLQDNHLEEEE